MVHGPIMEMQQKGKESERYLFWTSVDKDKVVLTNKFLSLLVQLMENSTFHHQRLHENEKIVVINHI